MTIYDVLNSPALLKRFCRDYNVPVSTFSPEHFQCQLDTLCLYSDVYKKRFDEFLIELSDYESEEKYFEYYNQVKDSVIQHIQSKESFHQFSLKSFQPSLHVKAELYTQDNNNKDFISVDLRKANFTILNLYCPDIFDGMTWEEFISGFGASDYIANSKYIRQVIFGACNPKKQIQAQTELMSKIADALVAEGYKIYSVVTDEIILSAEEGETLSAAGVFDCIKHYFPELASSVKVDYFNLRKNLQGYEKFIVASTDMMKCGPTFKCIDSDVFCQVIKYYYHQEITESDLVFDYKGSLARYISPIDNPFTNEYFGG